MFTRTALFGFLACAASPALAQAHPAPTVVPAAPFVKPVPPGELVAVDGPRRLHVQCKGKGQAVLIEAGLSQFTANSTYGKVLDQASAFARVCIYDRAGLGWSDTTASLRTHDAMVADLDKLIKRLRLRGKLVLVGHSIGGLLVRRYVALHPGKVAGVVLVEATPEATLFNAGAVDARKGIVAQFDKGLAAAQGDQPVLPMPADTPAEIRMAFTPTILRAVREEYLAIDRVPQAIQAQGYGTLGRMPLIVIRRGKESNPPSATDLKWREQQLELVALSTRGELVVADGSGHVVPYDKPEIVTSAIRKVIAQAARK